MRGLKGRQVVVDVQMQLEHAHDHRARHPLGGWCRYFHDDAKEEEGDPDSCSCSAVRNVLHLILPTRQWPSHYTIRVMKANKMADDNNIMTSQIGSIKILVMGKTCANYYYIFKLSKASSSQELQVGFCKNRIDSGVD